MPSFRPELVEGDPRPVTAEVVRELCADVTRPANVFVSPPSTVQRQYCQDETICWEISHGRLLDGTQTREERHFETWGLFLAEPGDDPPSEPVLALRCTEDTVYVTRAIRERGHQPVATGESVIGTREGQRWRRELVGAVRLNEYRCAGAVRDELACLLFHAVVGVSRLPLTSVEAPLPAFSLGRVGYFYRPFGSPKLATSRELLGLSAESELSESEYVKLLELAIRATRPADIADLAAQLPGPATMRLLRAVFNGVSLTPYTDFTVKTLELMQQMVRRGTLGQAGRADFIAHLICQLARHLTAYDLVTFHHRGANYPDALLLEDLLPELLALVTEQPELIAGSGTSPRFRRRAIRQALLLRLAYEGHRVPDVPTSPGENLRVLPAPHGPVPEEQIYSPVTRMRRLFADGFEPAAELARAIFSDLDNPAELRELGTALFLDRPFGFAKLAGEPDQTLLASHVLFSKSIASHRLDLLRRRPEWLPDLNAFDRWQTQLRDLSVDAWQLRSLDVPSRPGVVSLGDALQVADDWGMLSTTRQTIRDLARQYDLRPVLEERELPAPSDWRLLAPGERPGELWIYDDDLRPCAILAVDLSENYAARGGAEMPAAGLRVIPLCSQERASGPVAKDCRLLALR